MLYERKHQHSRPNHWCLSLTRLVVRKLHIQDHVKQETFICLSKTLILRFFEKYDNLVVCSMLALFGGHMIKKIRAKK